MSMRKFPAFSNSSKISFIQANCGFVAVALILLLCPFGGSGHLSGCWHGTIPATLVKREFRIMIYWHQTASSWVWRGWLFGAWRVQKKMLGEWYSKALSQSRYSSLGWWISLSWLFQSDTRLCSPSDRVRDDGTLIVGWEWAAEGDINSSEQPDSANTNTNVDAAGSTSQSSTSCWFTSTKSKTMLCYWLACHHVDLPLII